MIASSCSRMPSRQASTNMNSWPGGDPGIFRLPALPGLQFYDPQANGHSQGAVFTVKE